MAPNRNNGDYQLRNAASYRDLTANSVNIGNIENLNERNATSFNLSTIFEENMSDLENDSAEIAGVVYIDSMYDTKPNRNILLVLLPADAAKIHYQLHAINSISNEHIGDVRLSSKDAKKLLLSNAFLEFNMIFMSEFIDFKKLDPGTPLILEMVNKCNNGNCIDLSCLMQSIDEHSSVPLEYEQKHKTDYNVGPYDIIMKHLSALMEHLNSDDIANDVDVADFFALASTNKLNLYVHPVYNYQCTDVRRALLWITCFDNMDEYCGSFRLDLERLLLQLECHVDLLERVQIKKDVLDILPHCIPHTLLKIFRCLAQFHFFAVLYNAFGNFIFQRNRRLKFYKSALTKLSGQLSKSKQIIFK